MSIFFACSGRHVVLPIATFPLRETQLTRSSESQTARECGVVRKNCWSARASPCGGMGSGRVASLRVIQVVLSFACSARSCLYAHTDKGKVVCLFVCRCQSRCRQTFLSLLLHVLYTCMYTCMYVLCDAVLTHKHVCPRAYPLAA